MSDDMGRELAYLPSHATNRFFIPNWGDIYKLFSDNTCSSLLIFIKINIPSKTYCHYTCFAGD